MKKLLSILLAAAIAMSCVVYASAINEIEEFIESQQPLPELTLNRTENMSLDEDEIKAFAFVPAANGRYFFISDNADGNYAQGYLIGPGYEIMKYSYGFNIAENLQAGTTYYLIVSGWESTRYTIKVTNTQPPPFEIRNSRIEVKFGVVNNVFILDMLRCNDYDQTHLLVNGEKIPYIGGYFYIGGAYPNRSHTVRFATLDGINIGTTTLVCKATFWQWIDYFLLFGWFRLFLKPIEEEWYGFGATAESPPDMASGLLFSSAKNS